MTVQIMGIKELCPERLEYLSLIVAVLYLSDENSIKYTLMIAGYIG